MFTDITGNELYPPGAATLHVDRLFSGVAYFALDNADSVETLEELWERAASYILPELIASHRPQGHSLLAVEEAIITTNTEVRFVGPLFDMFY